MSTNGVIARTTEGFGTYEGNYHHWDSNPMSLGRSLFAMLHNPFGGNLKKMLTFVLDKHSSWSTLVDRDLTLPAGYSDDYTKRQPACHCHGARKEKNGRYTQADCGKGSGIQYVYVFDADKKIMHVIDTAYGVSMAVDLMAPEPDWAVIECGAKFERCPHMAWFHKLADKSCRLSTQEWLGTQPMNFRDVIAFVIDGKRYAATGSGGNSDYYNRSMTDGLMPNQPYFPANCWISEMKSKNGRRRKTAVARIGSNGEYTPFPGVTWVFPATAVNPNETLRTV